ncbi:MAG: hypothetical protein K0S33_227 [Bacteroidetes bacterium]|nr:hypothetical protein [Bacteroidota bacterium]
MSDKNGNQICEGHDVKFYYKGEYVTCTVVYSKEAAMFCLKWPDGYINKHPMNPDKYEVVNLRDDR